MRCFKTLWIYFTLIMVNASGHPTKEPISYKDESCIQITEDKQTQINNLVDQISSFINHISTKYEEIDLRLIEISVDRHTLADDHKNTIVKITINDCDDDIPQQKDKDDKSKSYNDKLKENNNRSNDSFSIKGGNTKIASGEKSSYVEKRKVQNSKLNLDEATRESKERNDDSNITEQSDEFKPENIDTDALNDDNFDDLSTDDFEKLTKHYKDTKISKENKDTESTDCSTKFFDDSDDLFEETDNKKVKNDKPNVRDTEIRFVNFKDKNNLKISDEIVKLEGNDAIFLGELMEARGNKPFVVYQRYNNNSQQYWFL